MSFVATSIVSTLIVLGIMVLVHEFGHFAVAKLCGVRVEVFSIGFGKRLFGITYGDTDYRLSLLPLGGYVKMAGELGGDGMVPMSGMEALGTANSVVDPGDLNSKPRWQRILIAVAGPVANFLLALLLMTGFYMMHNEVELFRSQPGDIDYVVANSAASQAGFQAGDRITHFEAVNNPTWEQISLRSAINLGQPVAVIVERDGKLVPLTLNIRNPKNTDDFDLESLGFVPKMQSAPVTVQMVEPSMPAAEAGIQSGDQIVSIDGRSLHSVAAIAKYLQEQDGRPTELVVRRDAKTSHPQTLHMKLQPVVADSGNGTKGYRIGFQGSDPPFQVEQLPFEKALRQSVKFNAKNSSLILEVLRRMITRHMAVQNLSGPIGIARETGLAASQPGWQPIIGLMAIISLNLGIFNLLPIPILDGGVILLLLIEEVIRRDLNQRFKERIYQAAFVGLLIFFAFVMFNDISKLSLFSKLKT
jgi:regulator of sigma E protease